MFFFWFSLGFLGSVGTCLGGIFFIFTCIEAYLELKVHNKTVRHSEFYAVAREAATLPPARDESLCKIVRYDGGVTGEAIDCRVVMFSNTVYFYQVDKMDELHDHRKVVREEHLLGRVIFSCITATAVHISKYHRHHNKNSRYAAIRGKCTVLTPKDGHPLFFEDPKQRLNLQLTRLRQDQVGRELTYQVANALPSRNIPTPMIGTTPFYRPGDGVSSCCHDGVSESVHGVPTNLETISRANATWPNASATLCDNDAGTTTTTTADRSRNAFTTSDKVSINKSCFAHSDAVPILNSSAGVANSLSQFTELGGTGGSQVANSAQSLDALGSAAAAANSRRFTTASSSEYGWDEGVSSAAWGNSTDASAAASAGTNLLTNSLRSNSEEYTELVHGGAHDLDEDACVRDTRWDDLSDAPVSQWRMVAIKFPSRRVQERWLTLFQGSAQTTQWRDYIRHLPKLDVFNLLVARLFFENTRTNTLQELFESKMRDKLANISANLPKQFCGTISLERLFIGGEIPLISHVSEGVVWPNGDLEFDFDVLYRGGLMLSIMFNIRYRRIKLPRVIFHVKLLELSGRMRFNIAPPPTRKFWLSGSKPPQLRLELTQEVTTKESFLGVVASMIPNLSKIATNVVKVLLFEDMVLPNFDDFPWPVLDSCTDDEDSVDDLDGESTQSSCSSLRTTMHSSKLRQDESKDMKEEVTEVIDGDVTRPVDRRSDCRGSAAMNSNTARLERIRKQRANEQEQQQQQQQQHRGSAVGAGEEDGSSAYVRDTAGNVRCTGSSASSTERRSEAMCAERDARKHDSSCVHHAHCLTNDVSSRLCNSSSIRLNGSPSGPAAALPSPSDGNGRKMTDANVICQVLTGASGECNPLRQPSSGRSAPHVTLSLPKASSNTADLRQSVDAALSTAKNALADVRRRWRRTKSEDGINTNLVDRLHRFAQNKKPPTTHSADAHSVPFTSTSLASSDRRANSGNVEQSDGLVFTPDAAHDQLTPARCTSSFARMCNTSSTIDGLVQSHPVSHCSRGAVDINDGDTDGWKPSHADRSSGSASTPSTTRTSRSICVISSKDFDLNEFDCVDAAGQPYRAVPTEEQSDDSEKRRLPGAPRYRLSEAAKLQPWLNLEKDLMLAHSGELS